MKASRAGGVALAAIAVVVVAAACGGRPPARTHSVEIQNLAYAPDSITVAPGDTVTWTNHDIVPHTISGPALESGAVPAAEHFSWTAGAAGAYRYRCAYHPTMTAVIVVR